MVTYNGSGPRNTASSPACATCPVHREDYLKRHGLDVSRADYVIALAGNPNTGKSTVFNALTGLRQHTGNWPGKTVTRSEGGFSFGGVRYRLVDLPGTYSLLSASPDEEIARDFILFGRPDVTVVVVDATRLQRNLNLVLQILEITDRVVVCLNLMDEVRRHGLALDDRLLARELGVSVVPTVARSGDGLDTLIRTIHEIATVGHTQTTYRIRSEPPWLKRAIDKLTERIRRSFPALPNTRWIALRLLDGDERIAGALRSGELLNVGSEHKEDHEQTTDQPT